MAKELYTVTQVSNMSSEDIRNLTDEELKSAIRVANSASKKRRDRLLDLEESGAITPHILRDGKIDYRTYKFKSASKNAKRQELVANLETSLKFLNAKSSTIRGYKSIIDDFAKSLQERFGIKSKMTIQQYSAYWNAYDKLSDYFKSERNIEFEKTSKSNINSLFVSDKIQEMIYDTLVNENINTAEELAIYISRKIENLEDKRVEDLIKQQEEILDDYPILGKI